MYEIMNLEGIHFLLNIIFAGQSYCLGFGYFIIGEYAEIAIYRDLSYVDKLFYKNEPTNGWITTRQTITVQSGKIPVTYQCSIYDNKYRTIPIQPLIYNMLKFIYIDIHL